MRILLFGNDVAPSKAFELIEPSLRPHCNLLDVIVAHGQGFIHPPTLPPKFSRFDLLLCGMSSTEERSQEEISTARLALQYGVKLGFYADIYGCHRRPWFTDLVRQADFLCVIDEYEAFDARKMFPNTKVIVTGNPTWEKFFKPTLTRVESRALVGVKDDEVMILAPGGKTMMINMYEWSSIISAVQLLDRWLDKKPKIFLSLHPGDTTPVELYQDLSHFVKVSPTIVTKDSVSTSDLIPGSDVVVGCYSTTGIEAACQRVPVIDYFTQFNRAEWKNLTGSSEWNPARAGASYPIDEITQGISGLAKALYLMTKPFKENVRRDRFIKRQEEVFPQSQFSSSDFVQTLLKVL